MLNHLINLGTVRCVSLEAASASMFSTPVMQVMGAWIFALCMIHAASQRRGPMTVAVLTLTRWDQISEALLSTTTAMCSSGAMHGSKCGGGKCMPTAPGC